MNKRSWIRQIHRWVSIAFTLCVIANFVAMLWGTPPAWITYSPLLPLALLTLTGLTMLVRSLVGGGAAYRHSQGESRV